MKFISNLPLSIGILGLFLASLGVSAASAANLSFNEIKGAVEGGQLSSVAETLSFLNKHYPDYLSHHTFMYDSKSLQEGSFAYPRAIVFGADGKFILSFNNPDPKREMRGTEALEMMEFDPQTSAYELHEIAFRKDSKSGLSFVKPYRISEANPAKCMMCHSSAFKNQWQVAANGKKFDLPVHPNWAAYEFWPGAYSGFADNLTALGRLEMITGQLTISLKDVVSRERTEFDKFMNKSSGERWHDRYAYLPPLFDDGGHVNARLGEVLASGNYKRIAALVAEKSATLKPYRYSMIAPLMCMREQGFTDAQSLNQAQRAHAVFYARTALPAPIAIRFDSSFLNFYNKCSQEFDSDISLFEKLEGRAANSSFKRMHDDFCVADTYQLSELMEFMRWAGINPNGLAMSLLPGSRRFDTGTMYFTEFATALIDRLFDAKEAQELESYIPSGEDFIHDGACKLVLERAAREMSGPRR